MSKYILFNEIDKTLFNGNLTSRHKEGIIYKLKAFNSYDITDDRWEAYMLATCYHETGGAMQPTEEVGKGAGKPYGQKLKYDRTIYAEPDRLFFGRGDVQLTWYENYEMMGNLLNLPLLYKPELALVPEISASIMIEGMTRGKSNRGDFTGVSLENYFNAQKEDPFNARRIINGLDCAKLIEGYYWKFLSALRNRRLMLLFIISNFLLMFGGCKSKQIVNEQVVSIEDSTAVWELNDSLQIEERQTAVHSSDLYSFTEDNYNYGSEMLKREIYYDTDAQIDSVSRRHPILSEIITTNIVKHEKWLKEHELMMYEDSIEKVNLSTVNSNLELRVDRLMNENKSVESKSLYDCGLKYTLIVLFAFFCLLLIIRR